MMIVTIGLALALQYVYQYFIASDTVKIVLERPEPPRALGPINYNMLDLTSMAISIVVIAAVGYALLRTRIGRATRAVSDNPALASASGIDVDKVIRLVWTVSAALAGLSGHPLLPGHPARHALGLRAADPAAAVRRGHARRPRYGVRGAGRLADHRPGRRAGARCWVRPATSSTPPHSLILILLLMVRPQGLLGRAERVG